jgi:hypothetical protein
MRSGNAHGRPNVAGCLGAVFLAVLLAAAGQAQSSRVDFNHQKLFLSGSNLAWFDFARDVGSGPVDTAAFSSLLLAIHNAGGNALRWWIHVDGRSTPEFDGGGFVSGPGTGTIAGLRAVLDLAWQREVGVDLCLWSFDMLRESNPPHQLARNLLLLSDTAATEAYIQRCLSPMVDSLKNHPAILCWEIFNEPEGMSQEFGWSGIGHVPMRTVQRFVNRCAGVIHRRDPSALVTTGAWSLMSLTDVQAAPGNEVPAPQEGVPAPRAADLADAAFSKYRLRLPIAEISRHLERVRTMGNFNYYADARLLAAGGDPLGTLDFYSVHFYEWAGTALSPLHHPAPVWGLNKPIVVAEIALKNTLGVGVERIYETLYQLGYAGALAWAWTDTVFSRRTDILASIQKMWSAHRSDVDVRGIGGDPPGGDEVPTAALLDQNYPNPFNSGSTIGFAVPDWTTVTLQVFDLLGRPVATLVDELRTPGTYSVRFDGAALAGGMYVYRLRAGAFVQSRRMVLIR